MPSTGETLAAGWPYILLIIFIIMAGLWLSNAAYDRGVPQYVSRKIGHGAGGVCFLLAPFVFSSVWIPLILACAFSFILILARLMKPDTFRGVGGNGRSRDSYAEIMFAAVAVPVYLLGWHGINQPYYATATLLFMAWGDGVTGLVRAKIYRKPVKGFWGSLAMLLVCLALAWLLIKPFWIGAAGAFAAVIAEFSFGDVGFIKRIDDNLAIPVVSLSVLMGISATIT
jgi:phytol kinase